jgi:hypothetical protein
VCADLHPPSSPPSERVGLDVAGLLSLQCDALRPACFSCRSASLICVYDLPAGLTRREAVKQDLRYLSVANGNLRSVIKYMRECSEDECLAIVRHIRQADSVDDAVQALVDASLLLPDTPTAGMRRGSEAGSPVQARMLDGTSSEAGEPPSSPEMQK